MSFENTSLFKLLEETVLKPFDCGDDDLNDFLFNKSKPYHKDLLATTFIIENEERTIGYFSIFNDSVRIEDLHLASTSATKSFLKKILPFKKRHLRYYPAIKIGRLGVCDTAKGQGLGKDIVSYVISMAIDNNKHCACKFITVDAYSQSLKFYEKMGFNYFSQKDQGDDTRQMYLDLTPIVNADNQDA
ncbi:GNAT family N-acetyltransferase [Pedobacter frigiditerrae]|uniref:GNAT family N-acetyltransferase n=1 Tax=Pedobacter frigiditerrae TaxID=2530452 RepID=UPI00292EC5F6|nr:GNAT family N-acetyltransferase [Pedobacter frigiditerrae]